MSGIHPSAFIGPDVTIGTGVTIGPFASVTGPCRIGDGAWIGPHTAIGGPPGMRDVPHPPADVGGGAGVIIGAGTVVRELVSVNQGSQRPTTIGPDCYVMEGSYVPHDAVLGAGTTVSPGVLIGGHCWIGDGVNLGMGAALHQFGIVGAFAMVGMQAVVTRPIPPFSVSYGVPARVAGANKVGLERRGVDPARIEVWDLELQAGGVAGLDGPAELAAHVRAYQAQLPVTGV